MQEWRPETHVWRGLSTLLWNRIVWGEYVILWFNGQHLSFLMVHKGMMSLDVDGVFDGMKWGKSWEVCFSLLFLAFLPGQHQFWDLLLLELLNFEGALLCSAASLPICWSHVCRLGAETPLASPAWNSLACLEIVFTISCLGWQMWTVAMELWCVCWGLLCTRWSTFWNRVYIFHAPIVLPEFLKVMCTN